MIITIVRHLIISILWLNLGYTLEGFILPCIYTHCLFIIWIQKKTVKDVSQLLHIALESDKTPGLPCHDSNIKLCSASLSTMFRVQCSAVPRTALYSTALQSRNDECIHVFLTSCSLASASQVNKDISSRSARSRPAYTWLQFVVCSV